MKRSTSFLIETAAMSLACSVVLASGGGPVSALPEALAPVPRITGMDRFSGPDPVTLASGANVQTVVFRKTQWSLKDMPQSLALSIKMEREASQLPEEKRLELMNRTDDHIQLWLVKLKEDPPGGRRVEAGVDRRTQLRLRYWRMRKYFRSAMAGVT